MEQQVSLASAKAALEKLRSLIGDITPDHVLSLSDEQLRACYFSRQKTSYARSLASAVTDKKLVIEELVNLSDERIRQELKQVKGIGDWTVDVFLLMSLHHIDVFPLGDIALLNSTRHIKKLDSTAGKVEIAMIAETWKPYRSIAAYLLWHAYLSKKEKVKSKK
ncbi:MAG: DNA-3-methyladenine glycosylase 2 family protein [Chitinophagaceae bacterium]|nr:DNA-3-methyladenine glycosylase 2 family protein [Chitinophagaceae bacterium]